MNAHVSIALDKPGEYPKVDVSAFWTVVELGPGVQLTVYRDDGPQIDRLITALQSAKESVAGRAGGSR